MMFKLFLVLCVCIYEIHCDSQKSLLDIVKNCGAGPQDVTFFIEHGKAPDGKEKNIECIFEPEIKAIESSPSSTEPDQTLAGGKKTIGVLFKKAVRKCPKVLIGKNIMKSFSKNLRRCISGMVKGILSA